MRMWERGCIKMTIEWLAGNRLRGTTAERPASGLASPSVGGWVELGRTTLGSATADISVASLADKRYYMILHNHLDNGTAIRLGGRFNNDSGANYAERRSQNGGGDSTQTNATELNITNAISSTDEWLGVHYISNLSANTNR